MQSEYKALASLPAAVWASCRRALNCERWVATPKVVIAGNLLAALLAANSMIVDLATLQAAAAF